MNNSVPYGLLSCINLSLHIFSLLFVPRILDRIIYISPLGAILIEMHDAF